MGPVQETRGQGRAPGLASFMDGDVVFLVLAAEALDCRREADGVWGAASHYFVHAPARVGGANESGDGDYESVTMGRAAAM